MAKRADLVNIVPEPFLGCIALTHLAARSWRAKI
jgi:hypothetical protein